MARLARGGHGYGQGAREVFGGASGVGVELRPGEAGRRRAPPHSTPTAVRHRLPPQPPVHKRGDHRFRRSGLLCVLGLHRLTEQALSRCPQGFEGALLVSRSHDHRCGSSQKLPRLRLVGQVRAVGRSRSLSMHPAALGGAHAARAGPRPACGRRTLCMKRAQRAAQAGGGLARRCVTFGKCMLENACAQGVNTDRSWREHCALAECNAFRSPLPLQTHSWRELAGTHAHGRWVGQGGRHEEETTCV